MEELLILFFAINMFTFYIFKLKALLLSLALREMASLYMM